MSDANRGASRTRADRFLAAFRDIEALVRRLANAKPGLAFGDALRLAAAHSPELRLYQPELLGFARLRNAITHEPDAGGQPIADPREDAVRQIEFLAELIERPPNALSVLAHPVKVATPEMSLRQAALLMFEGNFSQLPVDRGGGTFDVLTTQAIARYLTDALFEHGNVSAAATVASVIDCDGDRYLEVVAPNATVLAVVEKFESAETSGKFLSAVLVADIGSSEVRGIATLYDLPALLRAVRPFN
jgi:CBS domain-containing protein